MSDQVVQLDVQDRIAYLTLNRPDKRNAFNAMVIEQLKEGLSDVTGREEVLALVLRGNGPCFCAGADLEEMVELANATQEENRSKANDLADCLHRLYTLSMPTVACVHGAAYGGGLGLVACSDIALSYGDTTFALSEVRLGLIPAVISPYLLRAMGVRQAKRYMMTGETFDGTRAQELGLVHEVIEDGEQMAERRDVVLSAIRKSGPEAVKQVKELCHDLMGREIDAEVVRETARCIAEIRTEEEAQEGIEAFLEERSPQWRKDENHE